MEKEIDWKKITKTVIIGSFSLLSFIILILCFQSGFSVGIIGLSFLRIAWGMTGHIILNS